jgi:hypothetical protein
VFLELIINKHSGRAIEHFDRDSLGHEENDRRDEYIDKVISEKIDRKGRRENH